ncbi:MAG: HEAT repeat domain-containing protein, partial [Planctomycetales bacterium]
ADEGHRFSLSFLSAKAAARKQDPFFVLLAVDLLGRQRERKSTPLLKRKGLEDHFMTAACCRALGRLGTPESIRAVETFLDSPNPKVVKPAMRFLSDHGDKATLRLLEERSKNQQLGEPARRTYQQHAEGLSQILDGTRKPWDFEKEVEESKRRNRAK